MLDTFCQSASETSYLAPFPDFIYIKIDLETLYGSSSIPFPQPLHTCLFRGALRFVNVFLLPVIPADQPDPMHPASTKTTSGWRAGVQSPFLPGIPLLPIKGRFPFKIDLACKFYLCTLKNWARPSYSLTQLSSMQSKGAVKLFAILLVHTRQSVFTSYHLRWSRAVLKRMPRRSPTEIRRRSVSTSTR